MKRFFTLIVLSGFACLSAQNIVPNPGFETYSSCPTSSSQLPNAVPWLNAANSPEYMHTCSGSQYNTLPTNFWGYEPAATGNGCMGGLCYGSFASNYLVNLREICYAQLLTPMVIGQTYFVSFKVNLADRSSHAVNNLGIRFANSYTPAVGLNNFAHVYTTTVITQTNGWTTISGSFVADSTYTGLYIGNLFDDANTTVQTMGALQIGWNAYYFFDDICVSPNPLDCSTILAGEVEEIDAVSEDGERVDVTWKILAAEAVSEMEVQRSIDGHLFETIQRIAADEGQDRYHISDLPLGADGRAFYRIMALDQQGGTHTSKVATALLNSPEGELFQLASNPLASGEDLNIMWTSKLSEDAVLTIYDELGRLVWSSGVGKSKMLEIQVEGSTFNPGVYHVVLKNSGRQDRKSLVVLE